MCWVLAKMNRDQIIQKSLGSTKGTQRYEKRLKINVIIPNKAIADMDIDSWFKNDIAMVFISVLGQAKESGSNKGARSRYTVGISFAGVWNKFYDRTKPLSAEGIKQAIKQAFRLESELCVSCTCPDDRYRFAYVQTQGGYRMIDKNDRGREERPAKITNPTDSLGGCCKHVLCCLVKSHQWIDQLANATYKYITRLMRYDKTRYDMFIKDIVEYEREEDTVPEIVEEEPPIEEQQKPDMGFSQRSKYIHMAPAQMTRSGNDGRI